MDESDRVFLFALSRSTRARKQNQRCCEIRNDIISRKFQTKGAALQQAGHICRQQKYGNADEDGQHLAAKHGELADDGSAW